MFLFQVHDLLVVACKLFMSIAFFLMTLFVLFLCLCTPSSIWMDSFFSLTVVKDSEKGPGIGLSDRAGSEQGAGAATPTSEQEEEAGGAEQGQEGAIGRVLKEQGGDEKDRKGGEEEEEIDKSGSKDEEGKSSEIEDNCCVDEEIDGRRCETRESANLKSRRESDGGEKSVSGEARRKVSRDKSMESSEEVVEKFLQSDGEIGSERSKTRRSASSEQEEVVMVNNREQEETGSQEKPPPSPEEELERCGGEETLQEDVEIEEESRDLKGASESEEEVVEVFSAGPPHHQPAELEQERCNRESLGGVETRRSSLPVEVGVSLCLCVSLSCLMLVSWCMQLSESNSSSNHSLVRIGMKRNDWSFWIGPLLPPQTAPLCACAVHLLHGSGCVCKSSPVCCSFFEC